MGNKRVLKIALGVFCLVCFFYLIYALLFLTEPQKRDLNIGDEGQKTFSTSKLEVELDTITTTLEGGKFAYLKTQIALEGKNSTQKDLIRKNEETIRRVAINYLHKLNGENYTTPEGKEQLRRELLNEIQKNTGVELGNLYFVSFVFANRDY